MNLRTLHVTAAGAEVRKAGERIAVFSNGERLGWVRLYDLDAVHLYARAHLTCAALAACMDAKVRVCWYSGTSLVARAEPPMASHVLTRIAQVDRLRDRSYRTAFVRHLVAAKIASQRAVIARWGRARGDATSRGPIADALADLDAIAERLPALPDSEALRGGEGRAAAVHFRAVAALVDPALRFCARRSHPPPDPVNAALSFGYTLLASELSGLLAGAGVDPAIALLHGLRSGRDSLAHDAMEPFRAPIIDALVIPLFSRGSLGDDDFYPAAAGTVWLTPQGRKRFLHQWESWMRAPHRGAGTFGGRPAAGSARDDWRKVLRAQAVELRNAIIQKRMPNWFWQAAPDDDSAGITIDGPPNRGSKGKIAALRAGLGSDDPGSGRS